METKKFSTDLAFFDSSGFKTGCRDGDTFGEALKRYMKESGVTARYITECTGLSQSAITNYKNGGYIPKMKAVIALCIALRLHINRSEYLLKLCGYAFNDNNVEHSIWRCFIGSCYCSDLTVTKCDEILSEFNCAALSENS